MFGFFKRSSKESAEPRPRSQGQAQSSKSSSRLEPLAPLPLPEVLEGNEDSDWEMWEDSVLELDSRWHPEDTETRPVSLNTRPVTLDDPDIDAFAKITKRAP